MVPSGTQTEVTHGPWTVTPGCHHPGWRVRHSGGFQEGFTEDEKGLD